MPTTWSTISGRTKRHPTATACIGDFRYFHKGSADPNVVLLDPDVSLYCLDHLERRAIFVRTAGYDLNAAPFFYQAQFEAARELIAVPYETLHQLAASGIYDQSRAILLYSMGRCGSTLVLRALAQASRVAAISEPDVFTQLVYLRNSSANDAGEIDRVARSCLRVMCGSLLNRRSVAWCAIKFRGSVVGLWEILHAESPRSKVVFLYRAPQEWAESVLRSSEMLHPALLNYTLEFQQLVFSLFPYGQRKDPDLTRLRPPEEVLARFWCYAMGCYTARLADGAPIYASSYEELESNPSAILLALYLHCGITDVDPCKIGSVILRDSQEGSSLSRVEISRRNLPARRIARERLTALISQYSANLPGLLPFVGRAAIAAGKPLPVWPN